jgi:GMP synthase (glutamine-hydrolysing)
MLCYVILEHSRFLADHIRSEPNLVPMLRHKFRFEEISGLPCLIQHYTRVTAEKLAAWKVQALLLSGNETDWDEYDMTYFTDLKRIIREGDWPVLGFCGGMQLIGLVHDVPCGPMGRLPEGMADPDPDHQPGMLKEKGFYPINILRSDPLFDGVGERPVFCEQHYCELKAIPPGFVHLAASELSPIQAIRHETRPVYGTLFHPEEYSEEHPEGKQLLSNFFRICGL